MSSRGSLASWSRLHSWRPPLWTSYSGLNSTSASYLLEATTGNEEAELGVLIGDCVSEKTKCCQRKRQADIRPHLILPQVFRQYISTFATSSCHVRHQHTPSFPPRYSIPLSGPARIQSSTEHGNHVLRTRGPPPRLLAHGHLPLLSTLHPHNTLHPPQRHRALRLELRPLRQRDLHPSSGTPARFERNLEAETVLPPGLGLGLGHGFVAQDLNPALFTVTLPAGQMNMDINLIVGEGVGVGGTILYLVR